MPSVSGRFAPLARIHDEKVYSSRQHNAWLEKLSEAGVRRRADLTVIIFLLAVLLAGISYLVKVITLDSFESC